MFPKDIMVFEMQKEAPPCFSSISAPPMQLRMLETKNVNSQRM